MSQKALRGNNREYVQEVALTWAKQICLDVGIEVRSHGADSVHWDRPLVLAANHQSLSDIPVILAGLNRPFGFLTKRELFRIPAFGTAMLRLGCVSIDRSNPLQARDAIETASRQVRDGASIVVFPEGTRSGDGRIGSFKKGPFYLAQSAGVAVVPIGIVGTGRVLGKHGLLARPAKVELYVGEPVSCEGEDARARDALRDKVRAQILSMTGLGEA